MNTTNFTNNGWKKRIMKQNNIPINKPILGREEIKAVVNVMKTGKLTSAALHGGSNVQQLEKDFCKFTGAKYAVAVNNGTSALQASLMVLGIGDGDEVVVPSFTFVATVNAIKAVGAKPVFVDITPITCTMSPADLQTKITNKTKAIIPVHLYGHSANMKVIMNIAKYFNLPVVEDACQSLGTVYREKHTGTIGTLGCYSLYPGKVITSGEGGVIVTNKKSLYDKLLMIRNHGMVHGYDSKILGLNLRMTEISAAIGIVQLKKLPLFIKKRRENAKTFDKLLNKHVHNKNKIVHATELEWECRNYSLYTLVTTKDLRDVFVHELMEDGYGATVYYPTPVHLLPLYRDSNVKLPFTEMASKTVFSIPINPLVKKKDLVAMVKIIKNIEMFQASPKAIKSWKRAVKL